MSHSAHPPKALKGTLFEKEVSHSGDAVPSCHDYQSNILVVKMFN